MDLSTALLRTALNATALASPRLAGRAAFEVFCRPLRRSRVRSAERELHALAVTERLAVEGKTVTAYRWGDGARPVLLVHGWQSRASRFAPLIPGLRALGLTPVSFDAPGHGDSGGRATNLIEVRALIGQLHDRYGPFEAVVAHSFGVTCAFAALRDGVKADRLVAIAGVSEFAFLPAEFRRQLGLGPWAERELGRRIARLLPAGQGLDTLDATYRPADLGLPILAVHDEDDPTAPLTQARRLQDAYGEQLQLVVTRGLGHRRILGEPAVVDNVLGFLGAE
ncbi:alpha/beta hydrolase [Kitasatospora sp. NBC_00070]|uniref:alpha/beta hydrolase n=1 Tax=Kitasatospora sp. NBC_00070 TaxID=2975962 RepID=UPI003249A1B8